MPMVMLVLEWRGGGKEMMVVAIATVAVAVMLHAVVYA